MLKAKTFLIASAKEQKSKFVAGFLAFVLATLSCFLTPCVFAQLDINGHAAEDVSVSAYASLDDLYYDPSGTGVVYMDGSFYLENHDPRKRCTFDFEVRLEIFKADGGTLTPDAKSKTSGQLKKAAAPWHDIYESYSDGINIHIDCLDQAPGADAELTMSATVTLNATIGGVTESWQVEEYKIDFTHRPETIEELIHGLGPTTDGETFSGDCKVNFASERDWQSLVITDTPYDEVYWYVKAPGDTSVHGTVVEIDGGDGVERHATMTYLFPADVGEQFEEGAYYEITAYVYRSDLSVYWDSYQVWVQDTD